MIIQDSLTLDASGLTLTRDGYLVGDAKVSRAGNVQHYMGHELGLTGDAASQRFGVYRDPAVIFDQASMVSLAGRPVTRDHPREGVTADNWKDLAVGQMGGVIRRDGEHVVAPMAIMDAAAAKEVAQGARALSAGYTVEVTAADGVAEDGTPYQYRQSGSLRFNHVAYLPDNNPRAGNTRIGDHQSHGQGDSHVATTKMITFDGLPIETTDAGEAAINKLKGLLADSGKALTDANAAHATALAAKDTELAKKDAEITELKGKVVDGAALDKLVSDRAAVVAKAKAIAPTLDTAGKSNMDIKRAALGDAAKDKSDAYVDAAFDLKTDGVKVADPVRDAVKNGLVNTGDAAKAVNDAKASRRDYLANAHRGEKAEKAA